MTVPTYDQFIEPVLRFLAKHPDGVPAPAVREAAADALNLTPEQRAEVLPNGVRLVYRNRTWWAHSSLKRAGLSSSPGGSIWKLTEAGIEFARQCSGPLTSEQLTALMKSTPATQRDAAPSSDEQDTTATQSPDERLESAAQEINRAVGNELLELVMQNSPAFFEYLVLHLLHAMGYGTSRTDLQRVGGSGDAGIDGVISLDRLGLEKVYVQAKRWQNSVGRPEVQAFYGALAGQKANKGVFITTSTFTAHAVEFANSVERIVLVDGARLTELMIEHGVGVDHRTLKVPKVDSDYFEE